MEDLDPSSSIGLALRNIINEVRSRNVPWACSWHIRGHGGTLEIGGFRFTNNSNNTVFISDSLYDSEFDVRVIGNDFYAHIPKSGDWYFEDNFPKRRNFPNGKT